MHAQVVQTTRQIVALLVQQRFDELEQLTGGARLTAEELAQAVADYGRTLAMPSDEHFENLDIIEVDGASPPTYSVDVDLWTVEEGRSNLTLSLAIRIADDHKVIEINDLHVL